jgi:hypothetical protein
MVWVCHMHRTLQAFAKAAAQSLASFGGEMADTIASLFDGYSPMQTALESANASTQRTPECTAPCLVLFCKGGLRLQILYFFVSESVSASKKIKVMQCYEYLILQRNFLKGCKT